MKRSTILFITVNVLHVSGGFSAHHQELKNRTHSIGYTCQACLLLPLAWVIWNSPALAVAASKLNIYRCFFTVFELLMMGGETV